MTFFELMKQCLHTQAIRTKPDSGPILAKVMKEIKRVWKKEI